MKHYAGIGSVFRWAEERTNIPKMNPVKIEVLWIGTLQIQELVVSLICLHSYRCIALAFDIMTAVKKVTYNQMLLLTIITALHSTQVIKIQVHSNWHVFTTVVESWSHIIAICYLPRNSQQSHWRKSNWLNGPVSHLTTAAKKTVNSCATHLMTASFSDRHSSPNCGHELRTICRGHHYWKAISM